MHVHVCVCILKSCSPGIACPASSHWWRHTPGIWHLEGLMFACKQFKFTHILACCLFASPCWGLGFKPIPCTMRAICFFALTSCWTTNLLRALAEWNVYTCYSRVLCSENLLIITFSGLAKTIGFYALKSMCLGGLYLCWVGDQAGCLCLLCIHSFHCSSVVLSAWELPRHSCISSGISGKCLIWIN